MKTFTCIVCPNSCTLNIDEKNLKVEGNKCKRGEEFGINELTHPMRSISSTVRTSFKNIPVVPVRVDKEIPKEKIFDVMKEINKVIITKKLKIYDVVIENVCNTNSNVIVTSNILMEE